MKKIDLGQTITILANVGVILGIVFLGYEMRQNTTALESAAAQNINNQIAGINALRIDATNMALIMKGDRCPGDLSPLERAQYFACTSTIVQAWQNMYFQMRAGAYDAQLADGWWQNLRDAFERPGFNEYWDENGHVLSPDFRDFVATDVMRRSPTGDAASC